MSIIFTLCFISCGMIFDSNQAPALYFGIPFAVLALLYYYFKYNRKSRQIYETKDKLLLKRPLILDGGLATMLNHGCNLNTLTVVE